MRVVLCVAALVALASSFSPPASRFVPAVSYRTGDLTMGFEVPQKPKDFGGAQWAPTEFPDLKLTPPRSYVKGGAAAPPAAPAAAAAAPSAPAPSAAAPIVASPGNFVVTLNMPEGVTKAFECPPDQYILDQADELPNADEFADLPYACRAGSCSSCAGKVTSGTMDTSDCTFLSDEQKADGWVLTCTAKPTSDVTITTHMEEDLF